MTQPPYPPPTPTAPPAHEPRLIVRQVVLEVRVGGTLVQDIMWARIRMSFAEPVATAQFMTPVRVGNYDQDVEIRCGTIPGSGALPRFLGYLRNPSADMYPRAVTHNCVGRLSRAAEYFNGESLLGTGGLWIPQILGRPMSNPDPNNPDPTTGVFWTEDDLRAQSPFIVDAVLNIAGVPHNPSDIHGSFVQYGTVFSEFIWSAGTPTVESATSQVGLQNPLAPQQPGETALGYIQRYDQIDAEWNPNDIHDGGFYRTSEGLNGRVFRRRVGGRPTSNHVYTFIESFNIEPGATITRQYPTGNRMIVTGGDFGGITGPMRFTAARNNPFMPQGEAHYAPNPPSSGMIECATRGMAAQLGFGQNCETVAEAALLEHNRETPAGQVTTADDFAFEQGQTVRIEGRNTSGGQAPDRLLSNENFWVQGVTIDCGHDQSGAPYFRQTLDVQGGGIGPQP